MYKHIEDNGDIHMLVNSKGETLLVCAECGGRWYGEFTPFNDDKANTTRKYFAELLSANPELLVSLNIDLDKLL